MCDKLHHFMKIEIKCFALDYGIIIDIKIKLCKKNYEKEKVGGASKSNLHKH